MGWKQPSLSQKAWPKLTAEAKPPPSRAVELLEQPGEGSSPDSPMMAWTRTESCVRRIRVGRLPFLRWRKTQCECLQWDHHSPWLLAHGVHTHVGSLCPVPTGLRYPMCLT